MTTRGTSTAAYVNPLSLIDPVCNLDLVVSEGKISVTKGMLILCPQFPGLPKREREEKYNSRIKMTADELHQHRQRLNKANSRLTRVRRAMYEEFLDSSIVQLRELLQKRKKKIENKIYREPYSISLPNRTMKGCLLRLLHLRYSHISSFGSGDIMADGTNSQGRSSGAELAENWLQVCTPDIFCVMPASPWYHNTVPDNDSDFTVGKGVDFLQCETALTGAYVTESCAPHIADGSWNVVANAALFSPSVVEVNGDVEGDSPSVQGMEGMDDLTTLPSDQNVKKPLDTVMFSYDYTLSLQSNAVEALNSLNRPTNVGSFNGEHMDMVTAKLWPKNVFVQVPICALVTFKKILEEGPDGLLSSSYQITRIVEQYDSMSFHRQLHQSDITPP